MVLIEVSLKETRPLAELWSASNTLKSAVRGSANKHAYNWGFATTPFYYRDGRGEDR